MIPGELKVASGDIEINAGRKTVTVKVTNTGDRPVQVGSHYHFYETNEALRELLRFAISEDYFVLREKLGTAIASAAAA